MFRFTRPGSREITAFQVLDYDQAKVRKRILDSHDGWLLWEGDWDSWLKTSSMDNPRQLKEVLGVF